MMSTGLKLKLVENEKEFRKRFCGFSEFLTREVDKSEYSSLSKTKTIFKIIREVVKSSDELLNVFDKRKSGVQHLEALYDNITAHRLRGVDNLTTYCTHLLDIRWLLLSLIADGVEGMDISRLMDQALLPIHHVQEVLDLFQEIKEDLVLNRRLVEIFSCNSLIDQLVKELTSMRRVMISLHAEDLLIALEMMSISPMPEELEASLTSTLPETFTNHKELEPPSTSDQATAEPEEQNDTVHLGTQSENVDANENSAADGLISDFSDRAQAADETYVIAPMETGDTPDTGLKSPTESGSCQENPTDNHSVENSSVEIQSAASLELDDLSDTNQPKTLSRRESKKLIRSEVKSIEMKISELKRDIVSLEERMVSINSPDIMDVSGSEDESALKDEYEEVFEEDSTVAQPPTPAPRVQLRSELPQYDAGIRDRRTKHLLRSTILLVPLYQEYHEPAEDNPPEPPPRGDIQDLPGAADLIGVPDLPDVPVEEDTRPESGIEMEPEELAACYYTPMWNNGGRLDECVDYVEMIGRTPSAPEDEPAAKPRGWRLEEMLDTGSDSPYTTCRYTSRDSSCGYMAMGRTYANMSVENANGSLRPCQTSDSVYSSVHDIFGAVQIEKEADSSAGHCVAVAQAATSTGVTSTGVTSTGVTSTGVRSTGLVQRSGWCNIPGVRASGHLEKMTKKQRHLQEAKYELISSKVSYLKSLSILQAIFIENGQLKSLMDPGDWKNLFQYIGPIKQCSEHFLADLLSGWPEDIFMTNQLLVVRQYALTGLQTYVNYCSNKVVMDQTLANIRQTKPKVNAWLKKLESDEICDNNTLESFLVLPIQRITRFPLLVEGILHRMDSNTDKDFCDWAKTYNELKQMATKCNDAVRVAEERGKVPVVPKREARTLPRERNNSAYFGRPSRGDTLPTRHRSTVWHDQD